MSLQSELADEVYKRLESGEVPLAAIVHELRERWGASHGVGEVHLFVGEAVTCLLLHLDVEVGDRQGGRFVLRTLPPLEASDEIEAKLMCMDTFYEDESRYVFRKTQ